ncbi:MAG: HAD family hydrolase [Desulfobacterales bacterium]|nr:HAD family hydrolase [Desulfobacterales bacterium]
MLKAVLIDLDNTMVLFDEPAFYGRYFERLAPRFVDLWPSEMFQRRLIEAIGALSGNKGEKSNRAFFLDAFTRGTDLAADGIWQRFLDFYRTDYDRIPVDAVVPEGLHEALAELEQSGLPLVVATNPVFPLMVQEKRLSWAGLTPGRFALVTHMENTSYVKPRAGYYRQICERLGERPENCLMVGNDRVNDMAAARTGMKTYLTDEVDPIDYGSLSLTNDGHRAPLVGPTPDFTGSFADVPDAVARLMR